MGLPIFVTVCLQRLWLFWSVWIEFRYINSLCEISSQILQISTTRCIILLNIFISLLYMFWASMCPSSGGNYCIYAILVFVTLYGGVYRTPPIQSDKHQCSIDTVFSSWWWVHGCPKYVEKWNKYIKQNCVPSWTYLQDYTGMQFKKT